MRTFNPQRFGKWLILIGVFGFIASVVLSFTRIAGLDNGAIPAGAFLFIMLGVAFHFPSMLEESPGSISTMRIIVFAIVMVFCVIYLKIGWNLNNFENFTIDKTWIYILGLAFGSKVFQKFGEEQEKIEAHTEEETPGGGKKKQTVKKETEPAKGEVE
jgi:hypothetical protein